LLYFSAKPDAALTDDEQGLFLAVATADGPTGRFIDSGRPLQSGPGFDNIDPMACSSRARPQRWGHSPSNPARRIWSSKAITNRATTSTPGA
jgi:hypothetical protein